MTIFNSCVSLPGWVFDWGKWKEADENALNLKIVEPG